MKIRIFSLAKELNVDSKVLLDFCQKLGINLKPSALASITEEERDRVLDLMKESQSATPPAEVVAPAREPARTAGGKVPAVRSVAVPPRPKKEAPAEPPAPAAPAEAETPVEEPVAPAAKAPVVEVVDTEPPLTPPPKTRSRAVSKTVPHIPVKGTPQPTEKAEKPIPAAEVEAEPDSPPMPSSTVIEPEAPPAPAAPQELAAEADEPKQPAAMRREDYMHASGANRMMVARGDIRTLSGGAQPARKPKARPGPALPKLADAPPAPKSTAPVVQEAPAQKPEIRFPKELAAEKKPLQEHIKQRVETASRQKLPPKRLAEMLDETEEAKGKLGVKGKSPLKPPADARRRDSRGRLTSGEDDYSGPSRYRRGKRKSGPAVQLKSTAEMEPPFSIRNLSAAMGRPATMLVGNLMRKGVVDITINSMIDEETAIELAMDLGVDLQIKRGRDIEEELVQQDESEGENKRMRPPIVTILGHVDHGKTTLLDKIRSANVAAGEVGGITQHIAAYQVMHKDQPITFLDTPGHAAFAEMRARGANVTDIAVLVVAANDGVMPQTIEALNHAKAAGVPIVVAMNKSDLPDRNEQRVLQDLAGQNLLAAEWGGDTEVIRTSGMTGAGVDELLETLLTIAELHELTADPTLPGRGVCLEAFRDEGRGPIAWLVVEDGSLKKGDIVLCGEAFGRVRGMYDDRDRELLEAPPSTPVKISGLDILPNAGDKFYTFTDIEEARGLAVQRRQKGREKSLSTRSGKPRTLQDIVNEAQSGGIQELPLILKADSPGSVEALKGELSKFQHAEVRVNILHHGVGAVNESDVYLASASGAIIVAFHIVPDDRAQALAEQEGVEIRKYGIIYEISDDIKRALEGLLKPEVVEVNTGRALVLQTFNISRFGKIAGCRVLNGTIERSHRVRVERDRRVINDYTIQSLRRNKDDVKDVREGMECGVRLDNFDDIKEGDILQAYRLEEIKRTLE